MAAQPEMQTATVERVPDPVNLRKVYPIALRSIVRRSFVWIVGLLIVLFGVTLLDALPSTGFSQRVFDTLCMALVLSAALLVIGKLIYECIFYHTYYYGVELEQFVVSRGVLFKTRASFPIAKLTDTYLHRTPLDLVLGLYNLVITTPSPLADYGTVTGLPARHAKGLQNYLVALASTATPMVDSVEAERLLAAEKASDDPTITGPSPARQDPPRFDAFVDHTRQVNREARHDDSSQPLRRDAEPNTKPLRDELESTKSELQSLQAELRQTKRGLARAKHELANLQLRARGFAKAIPSRLRGSQNKH